MTKSVTSPEEWRRRAALVVSAPTVQFPPPPSGAQDASGGWVGPSGRVELGASALGGWAALEAGDDNIAGRAAVLCRRLAWEQPDDVPGVLLGWEAVGRAGRRGRPKARVRPTGATGAAAAS